MTNKEWDREAKEIGNQTNNYTDRMKGKRKKVYNMTQKQLLMYEDDIKVKTCKR